jgi:putative mycofactocin binding protein MftB
MIKQKYKLAPGTQVREEDFGLLFYTMAGPRLYFLASGHLLKENFFAGEITLAQWLSLRDDAAHSCERISALKAGINRLLVKGVILEC